MTHKHAVHLLPKMKPSAILSTLMIAALTACSGGGAGDDPVTNNSNDSAVSAIGPLVGVWNLPGNWRGEENDVAYLVIKQPGTDGRAESIVYDYDDASTGLGRDCYYVDGTGEVFQSLTEELFLDISAFPDAVVSLATNGRLVLSYNDGPATSTSEPNVTLNAERIDIAEVDITPFCSGL